MSIYEYLQGKTPDEIAEAGFKLPDCDIVKGQEWVPGAFEGVLLRSDLRIKQHSLVNYLIASSVKRQALNPSEKNKKKMLKRFSKYTAISIVDPLCSFCIALKMTSSPERKEALRALAIDLVKNEEKREVVKIGIALLGICGVPKDTQMLKVLGIHDEFTIYVAGTAVRLLEENSRNAYLTDMAENVTGWGKIAVLYELNYNDEFARLWAVKNGCVNTVGLSYAANVCATKGKMADILEAMLKKEYDVEEELLLFFGICDIFTGLLNPSEGQDGLSEYSEARRAAQLFTNICSERPELKEKDARADKICRDIAYIC